MLFDPGKTPGSGLFLQPGQPGSQSPGGFVQRFIAKTDHAQLHIHPPVGRPPKVGGRGLKLPQHLGQPGNGQPLREPPQGPLVIAARQQSRAPSGGGLADEQIPGQGSELPHQTAHILARGVKFAHPLQSGACIPADDLPHQGGGLHVSGQAQGIQDLLLPQLLPGAAGALVQQRKGIPHTAVGQPGQEGGPLVGERDPLLLCHVVEPPRDPDG